MVNVTYPKPRQVSELAATPAAFREAAKALRPEPVPRLDLPTLVALEELAELREKTSPLGVPFGEDRATGPPVAAAVDVVEHSGVAS